MRQEKEVDRKRTETENGRRQEQGFLYTYLRSAWNCIELA